MLKNKTIIDQLNTTEKVALVTDFFKCMAESSFDKVGLPSFSAASLNSLNKSSQDISFGNIARSWNTALMEERAHMLCSEAYDKGVRFVTTPDIRTVTNPYDNGLSEDPYLCGAMGGAMVRGAHHAGVAVGVKKLSLSENDLKFLDLKEDEKAIYDLFVKPFVYAARDKYDAVYSDLNHLSKNYFETNIKLFMKATGHSFGEDVFTVSENTETSIDFHNYLGSNTIIGGMKLKLSEAVDRYKRLSVYRGEGSINERDFVGAVNSGSAISEEELDTAVDKIIDFAEKIRSLNHIPYQSDGEFALQVARESTVLIKNNKALPLKRGTKVAVIGMDKYIPDLTKAFDVAGFAQGYDINAQQSDLMIPEAMELGRSADVLLVFLAPDSTSLKLPANRIALCRALKRLGKKMIAIVTGELPVELSFDSLFDGVLLLPELNESGRALSEILLGAVNPSGRLTRTHYDNGDDHYRRHRESVETGGTRIGSFIGYRYYDSINKPVRYHFGHGLSYTKFSYSGLSISGGKLKLTLSNVGNFDGAEVVQVYVGNLEKTAIAPKKELKAFAKVFVRAGESKTITLRLPLSSFKTYNAQTGGETVEAGSYTVYVGSSVTDIRMSCKVRLTGDERESTGESPADYFTGDGKLYKSFKLESVPSSVTHKKLRGFKLAGTILMVVLLLLVLTMTFMLLTNAGDTTTEIVFLAQFFSVAVIDAIFLIIASSTLKKAREREVDGQLIIKDAQSFRTTPERLFDLAFGDVSSKQVAISDDEADQYSFDRSATFEVLKNELKVYLLERGVDMEEYEISNLISAMAASKLIIVPRRDSGNLIAFFELVAQFFGKEMFTDNADNCMKNAYWYKHSGENTQFSQKTNFSLAIESSRIEFTHLHLTYISHISEYLISELLKPIADELRQRKSMSRTGEEVLPFPDNLWVIAEVESDEALRRLPDDITEVASVIIPKYRDCEGSEQKTIFKPYGLNQFNTLTEFVRSEFPLDEKLWKHIDKLEELINKAHFYSIDNKLWIKMEKHTSTFIACGGSEIEALGAAVATQLLPQIYELWNTPDCGLELVLALENFLGSDGMKLCNDYFDCINYNAKLIKENMVVTDNE